MFDASVNATTSLFRLFDNIFGGVFNASVKHNFLQKFTIDFVLTHKCANPSHAFLRIKFGLVRYCYLLTLLEEGGFPFIPTSVLHGKMNE